jgi:hypothetical protein
MIANGVLAEKPHNHAIQKKYLTTKYWRGMHDRQRLFARKRMSATTVAMGKWSIVG